MFKESTFILVFMLFPIIIELINPLGGEGGLPRFGGWNLFSLLIFTLYGYLLISNEEFKKSIEKHEKLSYLVGIISVVLLTLVLSFFSDEIFYDSNFSMADFLFWVIRGIYGWSWIIVLFNVGRKHLNINNKSRKLLNEIVMPFMYSIKL